MKIFRPAERPVYPDPREPKIQIAPDAAARMVQDFDAEPVEETPGIALTEGDTGKTTLPRPTPGPVDMAEFEGDPDGA
ncbi:hypothetical protein [Roseivivax sp.]